MCQNQKITIFPQNREITVSRQIENSCFSSKPGKKISRQNRKIVPSPPPPKKNYKITFFDQNWKTVFLSKPQIICVFGKTAKLSFMSQSAKLCFPQKYRISFKCIYLNIIIKNKNHAFLVFFYLLVFKCYSNIKNKQFSI